MISIPGRKSPLTSRTGLSIRSRTILGYLFLAICTLAACLLALVHMYSVQNSNEIVTSGSRTVQQICSLELSWMQMMSIIDMMLLTRQSTLSEDGLVQARSDLNQSMLILGDEFPTADGEHHLSTLEQNIQMASEAVDSIASAASQGKWATAQIIHHTDLSSIERRIEEELSNLRISILNQVDADILAASQMQKRMRNGLVVIVIIVALLGPIAAVMTASSIVKPIEYLASAVRSLKPEGLSGRLKVNRSDEIGELANAYNSMTERLLLAMKGLNTQVEAHRRMQEALKNSEARYRSLFQHSPISLWQLFLTDKARNPEKQPDGSVADLRELVKVIDVNQATLELLAASNRNQLSELGTVLTTNARQIFREALAAFSEGAQSYRAETSIRDFSGKTRYVIAHFAVPPDSEPGLKKVFLSLLDITARKEMEKALKESEEQYYQAQKMEAVGRLTGGIAHDFNNLLTVILSNCDLAMLEKEIPAEVISHLTQIQGAAARAATVTEQLLAFSRQQISNPVILNLNSLLEEVGGMLRRLIGDNIEMTLKLQPDINPVIADGGQIEQVVMNLAVNAKDAMPDGGHLEISTSEVVLGDEQCAHKETVHPGGYVLLSVSDNGLGMTKDVLEKAFDPFFTTKEQGKGTGLGLASVHGIVSSSGGCIDVQSEPNQGTTVNIYLPSKDGAVCQVIERESSDSIDTGSETILLVEDEAGVREIASKALSLSGYKVIEAVDSITAFEVFRENAHLIDLLVSDVMLPGMVNGIEIARLLKERKPEIGVVLMSGYIQDAIDRSGNLPDSYSFIAKPFSIREFLAEVRSALDSR